MNSWSIWGQHQQKRSFLCDIKVCCGSNDLWELSCEYAKITVCSDLTEREVEASTEYSLYRCVNLPSTSECGEQRVTASVTHSFEALEALSHHVQP